MHNILNLKQDRLALLLNALGKARLNKAALDYLGIKASYSMLLTRWRRGLTQPTIEQVNRLALFAAKELKIVSGSLWLENWLFGSESTDIDTILHRLVTASDLKLYREELKLTQKACAEILGISRATLITKERLDDPTTLGLARNVYPQLAARRST